MGTLWRIGEEELSYIEKAVDSGLSGEMNNELEEKFAKRFGVKYAIGVNSGTSALHSALFAANVKSDDEVIVPPITFAAPAFAALHLGAVPVFADVDPRTFVIDPEDIRRKITEKTKAIIPVHLYGLPADMDPIMELAQKYDLKVIEDCAESYLGAYRGRIAGTIGNLAIFSLERSKHITSGNGGIVITDSEELAEKVRKFSGLGYSTLSAKQGSYKATLDKVQHPDFKRHELLGFNYRLPEVCAAMALAQLGKLDELVEKRREIASLYDEAIEGCEWLTPQVIPEGCRSSFWTYVIKLEGEEGGISWIDFRKRYLEYGGERFYAAWSVVYLEPALEGMRFPKHNLKYERGLCPVAEELQPKLIQLKTNFMDVEYARKQASALKRTIREFS